MSGDRPTTADRPGASRTSALSGWRSFKTLTAKELRILSRDRKSLVLLFAMPAAFILLLSIALSDVYDDKTGAPLPVRLEIEDEGPFAARVRDILEHRADVAWSVETQRAARGDTDDTPRATLVIPAGYSDAIEAFLDAEGSAPFGGPALTWRADPTLDAAQRRFVEAIAHLAVLEAMFDDLVDESRLAYDARPRAEVLEALDARDRARRLVEPARDATGSSALPTPLQQTVPGWALFAMGFIVVPIAESVVRERRAGTSRRVLASPSPRGAIVASKIAPYWLVNVVQLAAMIGVGTLLAPLVVDARLTLGSNAWQLVPVTFAAAFAATGFGVAVATVARTAEQAAAFGSTAIVVLALLGGIMVPRFMMPDGLQAVALASPLYWGHQAYLDVLLRGAPLGTIVPKLGVLVAFGAVGYGVAVGRMARLPS